jgi:hypothetical protein
VDNAPLMFREQLTLYLFSITVTSAAFFPQGFNAGAKFNAVLLSDVRSRRPIRCHLETTAIFNWLQHRYVTTSTGPTHAKSVPGVLYVALKNVDCSIVLTCTPYESV